MQDTVKITEFPINEISEKERIKASEKAYHQAEQSIRNEKMLKSSEYPKEVIMRLEESNRIGTIRADTVQELVRCKDCKHRYVTGITTQYYVCDFMDAEYRDDGYCHRGERIEE